MRKNITLTSHQQGINIKIPVFSYFPAYYGATMTLLIVLFKSVFILSILGVS